MNFPSKKDTVYFLVIWGAIVIVAVPAIKGLGFDGITFGSTLGIILAGVIIGFLIWMWFGTGYKVEEGMLVILSGPMKWTVQIEEITKINKVKHPFTAPALSMDRLEILYGKFGVVTISPKNESNFIKLLLKENPQIKIDEKLSNSAN